MHGAGKCVATGPGWCGAVCEGIGACGHVCSVHLLCLGLFKFRAGGHACSVHLGFRACGMAGMFCVLGLAGMCTGVCGGRHAYACQHVWTCYVGGCMHACACVDMLSLWVYACICMCEHVTSVGACMLVGECCGCGGFHACVHVLCVSGHACMCLCVKCAGACWHVCGHAGMCECMLCVGPCMHT